jgi:acetylornithine deacetylase/succinyl-diaminopimelate desuccinylase-like protein
MDSNKFKQVTKFIAEKWQYSLLQELTEYIKIPCLSPAFDANWQEHKYFDQVINQFKNWLLKQEILNLTIDVIQLPNRTPLLYLEIPAFNTDNQETILLYGHLDKQPEMVGWHADKAPWKPVIQDNKLYGRGGADDGYAIFASVTAIAALQQQNLAHPRCVVIIEACEESGSYDLPYYIDYLQERIKTPSLVICLDSGCGNYEQFWLTTSLRGNIRGMLTVELIKEGIHSGAASGIVPSSFRVIRQLLSRLEDEHTGEIICQELQCSIPEARIKEAELTAKILDKTIYSEFPFWTDITPVTNNNLALLLNRTWRAQLAITGADGLPKPQAAGNVMRPSTSLVLSMRLPPNANAKECMLTMKQVLEQNPPYNAKVTFESNDCANGWNSPATKPWLAKAVTEASELAFNKPAAYWGEGGTIPFMAMLGEKFPDAQFVITGVLGPKSNAHGPNEFLHLPMAEKLTCCISYVINAMVK